MIDIVYTVFRSEDFCVLAVFSSEDLAKKYVGDLKDLIVTSHAVDEEVDEDGEMYPL